MAQSINFDIIARDKASATLSKIGKSSEHSEGALKKFGGTAVRAFGLLGVAVGTAGAVDFFKETVSAAREAQKATALTNAVIKSTGGVAQVSAEHVAKLSESISHKAGIDHLAIQSGENLLLTFKNIRNEAGRGNRIFDQATQAAVDLGAGLAAASGSEVNFRQANTLVGKALNDPIKGLTALRRVGVAFTKGQQAQIKTLVETGHRMKAQKIILKELKSEFGGAAASQATASDKAKVAIKDLQEQIGKGLLPIVDRLAKWTSDEAVPAVSKFVTGMEDGTGAGGQFADALKTTLSVGKGVMSFLQGLPGPVKKFGVETLVALLVLNKFNGALSSGRSSVSKWANSFVPADRQMTRLQKSSYMLGGALRSLAGAGGMIAVVDGSKRSNKALGALEVTAGAAAAGFAVGGPLGAALGAAGGALYSLGKWAWGTDKAMRAMVPTDNALAATLDGVGAASTRATRALVLESLQKSGLLKETQALNISDRDAVQAAMGNEAARKRVSAALAEATAQGHNYQALNIAQHLGAETTAINSSRVEQLKKNLALAGTKAEAQQIQAKLDRLARTNATANISIGGADAAINKLNAVLTLIHQIGASKGGNAQLPKPGSLLGGLTKRATGGPVTAGQPYVVGDRGPRSAWELFVPRQSGTIVPHVGTATASAGLDPAALEQAIYRGTRRAMVDGRAVITTAPDLATLDLMVGAA